MSLSVIWDHQRLRGRWPGVGVFFACPVWLTHGTEIFDDWHLPLKITWRFGLNPGNGLNNIWAITSRVTVPTGVINCVYKHLLTQPSSTQSTSNITIGWTEAEPRLKLGGNCGPRLVPPQVISASDPSINTFLHKVRHSYITKLLLRYLCYSTLGILLVDHE